MTSASTSGGVLKRRSKSEAAPPVPPIAASRINAHVELRPPSQYPADVQAHVSQESALDFERYLRWADKAMETHTVNIDSVEAVSNRDWEVDTNDNLKVARYEPLTFQCIRCDQQFAASGKSLQEVADEVSDHIARKHPCRANSEFQQKRAA